MAYSLHDLLNLYLRENGLETPLLQYRVEQAWPEVMGEVVSRYTREVFVREGKLHVRLVSPGLRQNLQMEHRRIAQKLNERVGQYVISDVCFY